MSLDSDIDLILAGGEDVFTAGEITVQTSLMEHDAVMGATEGSGGVYCGQGYVLLRASLFSDLKTGDQVSLNGQPYTVTQKPRIQDGKILQVYLGDPNA